MGNFVVIVKAVGGHGCQRDVKGGAEVQMTCGSVGCPDCQARAFVQALKHAGNNVEVATLYHWPGQPGTVIDDLLTHKRTGSF